MKKGLLLFLSAALVFGMLSGCIASEPSQAESASAAIPTETAAAPASNLDPEASVQELEASVQEAAPTGAVIPAEDCRAKGYDVKYGMFDFETYVELPLTEEPRTLSYWFMIQPFMMGYNNVTENDFTYFKEMEARTGVHLDLKAVSMFSSAEHWRLHRYGGGSHG